MITIIIMIIATIFLIVNFALISNVNVSWDIHLTTEFVRLGENSKTRGVMNRNAHHIFLGRSSQGEWDRRDMWHELERKEI